MLKYYFVKMRKKFKGSAIKNSLINKKARISGGNTILCSEIGAYSYTGYDTQILFCKIGRYCSIGSDCKIGGGGHPLDWVSTSPLFHSGKNVFKKHFAQNEYNPHTEITIGNDVWIGQDVIIKGGISIGNGAVIGMGAVVTKNVGAYEIWGGNPAKFIRKRFDDETIAELISKQWWNLSDDEIKKYGEIMNEPKKFLEAISK